jgi:Glutathione S-transferase N-terminal domain
MKLTLLVIFPEQEDWAPDTKLFMPYDVEQILLADNANCLAVQTFLKICNLPYKVEFRKNAEFMSPTGKSPLSPSWFSPELIKSKIFRTSAIHSVWQILDTRARSHCDVCQQQSKRESLGRFF